MQDANQTFAYTARRSTYLTTIGAFAFMLLVEGGFIALIALLLIPILWLKFVLAFALLCLYLVIILNLLGVLWTKHHLTLTHLHLHYGRTLATKIPLTAIREARPVHERLTVMQTITVQYLPQKQRISASFSEQGQVLLLFNEALPIKVRRKVQMVSSILFNVDQRDALLAALHTSVPALEPTVRQASTLVIQPEGSLAKVASTNLPSVLPGAFPQNRLSEASTMKKGGEYCGSSSFIAPPPGNAIRIEALTCRFADFIAVDHLTMSIARGEIYGFLGSNGAGKTTTMKTLVGLLQPSAGQVWIAGHNVWTDPLAAKAALGYVADRSLLYERLTGREFLAFLAQIRGLSREVAEERITHLLVLLDLAEQADRLCGAYSFGMKRKLSLAGALLHQPPVLILDEPLNGLDPRSARHLKDLLLSLAAQGTGILLSTHDLATAETVCHRVGIIHKGRLLAEGSAAELRQLAAAPDLETVFLHLIAEQPEGVAV